MADRQKWKCKREREREGGGGREREREREREGGRGGGGGLHMRVQDKRRRDRLGYLRQDTWTRRGKVNKLLHLNMLHVGLHNLKAVHINQQSNEGNTLTA